MLLCIKNDCPLVNMDSVISLVKQQLVKTYIILCTPHNIHKVILMQVISFSIFHVPVCPIFLIAILYE